MQNKKQNQMSVSMFDLDAAAEAGAGVTKHIQKDCIFTRVCIFPIVPDMQVGFRSWTPSKTLNNQSMQTMHKLLSTFEY